MARNLTFVLGGKEYPAIPSKIERKDLYGSKETLALDDSGNICKAVSIDLTGTMIIPRGGIGMGIVSPDGYWVEKSELKTVTLSGDDAVLMKSSYDAPVELKKTVSAEEFLNHTITGFYQIDDSDGLPGEIKDKIYTFVYNYRDGYEGSQAFLMESGGSLFMLLGYRSEFEMLMLSETAYIDAEEEENDDENGEIDFFM